jgi:hypothetical protein
LPESFAPDRISRPGQPGLPFVASARAAGSRPVIVTLLPLLTLASVPTPKTARPLPLLTLLPASTPCLAGLLALTSLLSLLALLFFTTLLALASSLLALLFSTTLLTLTSSLLPLWALLFPRALLPVLWVFLLTRLRLTLILAPFLLPWALPLLARASSRLSRRALLSLLLILTLPAFTLRIFALLLLPVRAVYGVTSLAG